jgi:hypothetical protein
MPEVGNPGGTANPKFDSPRRPPVNHAAGVGSLHPLSPESLRARRHAKVLDFYRSPGRHKPAQPQECVKAGGGSPPSGGCTEPPPTEPVIGKAQGRKRPLPWPKGMRPSKSAKTSGRAEGHDLNGSSQNDARQEAKPQASGRSFSRAEWQKTRGKARAGSTGPLGLTQQGGNSIVVPIPLPGTRGVGTACDPDTVGTDVACAAQPATEDGPIQAANLEPATGEGSSVLAAPLEREESKEPAQGDLEELPLPQVLQTPRRRGRPPGKKSRANKPAAQASQVGSPRPRGRPLTRRSLSVHSGHPTEPAGEENDGKPTTCDNLQGREDSAVGSFQAGLQGNGHVDGTVEAEQVVLPSPTSMAKVSHEAQEPAGQNTRFPNGTGKEGSPSEGGQQGGGLCKGCSPEVDMSPVPSTNHEDSVRDADRPDDVELQRCGLQCACPHSSPTAADCQGNPTSKGLSPCAISIAKRNRMGSRPGTPASRGVPAEPPSQTYSQNFCDRTIATFVPVESEPPECLEAEGTPGGEVTCVALDGADPAVRVSEGDGVRLLGEQQQGLHEPVPLPLDEPSLSPLHSCHAADESLHAPQQDLDNPPLSTACAAAQSNSKDEGGLLEADHCIDRDDTVPVGDRADPTAPPCDAQPSEWTPRRRRPRGKQVLNSADPPGGAAGPGNAGVSMAYRTKQRALQDENPGGEETATLDLETARLRAAQAKRDAAALQVRTPSGRFGPKKQTSPANLAISAGTAALPACPSASGQATSGERDAACGPMPIGTLPASLPPTAEPARDRLPDGSSADPRLETQVRATVRPCAHEPPEGQRVSNGAGPGAGVVSLGSGASRGDQEGQLSLGAADPADGASPHGVAGPGLELECTAGPAEKANGKARCPPPRAALDRVTRQRGTTAPEPTITAPPAAPPSSPPLSPRTTRASRSAPMPPPPSGKHPTSSDPAAKSAQNVLPDEKCGDVRDVTRGTDVSAAARHCQAGPTALSSPCKRSRRQQVSKGAEPGPVTAGPPDVEAAREHGKGQGALVGSEPGDRGPGFEGAGQAVELQPMVLPTRTATKRKARELPPQAASGRITRQKVTNPPELAMTAPPSRTPRSTSKTRACSKARDAVPSSSHPTCVAPAVNLSHDTSLEDTPAHLPAEAAAKGAPSPALDLQQGPKTRGSTGMREVSRLSASRAAPKVPRAAKEGSCPLAASTTLPLNIATDAATPSAPEPAKTGTDSELDVPLVGLDRRAGAAVAHKAAPVAANVHTACQSGPTGENSGSRRREEVLEQLRIEAAREQLEQDLLDACDRFDEQHANFWQWHE